MSLLGCLSALLLKGPSHGYELKTTLEAELGPLWMTRASQVYLTLGRMVRDGLVNSRRIRQTRRPDRQLLGLTAKGRELGYEWLFEPDDPDEIVVRLAVGRLVVPDRFKELITAIVEERAARLRQLRQLRATVDQGFQKEAVDAEIHRVQADLRWVESLAERISALITRPRAVRSAHQSERHAG